MADDGAFRIADLLAEQELRLGMVTEGDPDTPVHGAHSIEIANPSRWLRSGWLMLTTGTRFAAAADTSEEQRALVRELHEAGIAALAFGVGVCMDSVPRALVDEARRRGFPVLSVPLEIPFLEVIDVVNRATLTKEAFLLRRTVSIQDYLLESLAERDAPGALVHRLAELLRASVVLYDQWGGVLASSGVGPTQIIRAEIAGHTTERRRFSVGRWHVLTDPIRTDTMLHWLAVASRRHSVSRELAEPAMEAARRLVTMIVRSRASVQAEDRLRRSELLRLVLGGNPRDSQYIWDRLEMHRFRRGVALRLFELSDTRWEGEEEARLGEVERLERAAPAERAAHDADVRLVIGAHGSRVVGVVQDDAAAVQRWLAALGDTVHCGMSEPFADLARGPTRAREAELALAAARRDGHRSRQFEDVGLMDWLVAGRDTDSVRRKAHQVLAPIAANPPLLQALEAYLSSDCDVQRTARHLGLHPNSVRYRLRRAAECVGRDLHRPDDLAELTLGLRLRGE